MADNDQWGYSVSIPGTRAGVIASELRRLIVLGELTPGMPLRQADVARRFNVSTTPVREAFTTLAGEGLLRQDSHRGVVVVLPTLADLRENYEIRGALEPLAAELAATAISDHDIADLKEILEDMKRTSTPSERKRLNRDLHLKIYAAAGRQRLAEIIESLRAAAEVYLQLVVSQIPDDDYVARVNDEHFAIVEALEAHDPEAARETVAAHLQFNGSHFEVVLSGVLEDPQ